MALDQFIDLSNNELYRNLKNEYDNYDLSLRMSNCIKESFYMIELKLFRTHMKITLQSKMINKDNFNIVSNELLNKKNSRNFLEIEFLNINSLISTDFGFFLVLEKSEEFLAFNIRDLNLKLILMEQVKKRCFSFLNKEIQLLMNYFDLKINVKVDLDNDNQFIKNYECFKLTTFKDYVKILLRVNDSFIYEIYNQKIANKISIENIYKITQDQSYTNNLNLYFKNGHCDSYYFNCQNMTIFISQIKGIIEDKKKLNPSFSDNFNFIYSVGNYDIETLIVNGKKHSTYIMNTYEKNILKELLEIETNPSLEVENILNILLINGKFTQSLNFNLREFLMIFKKHLKDIFSIEKALKIISQSDAELYDFLMSKTEITKKEISEEEKIKKDKLMMANKVQSEKISLFNISFKFWELLCLLIQNNYFFKKISYDYNSNPKTSNIFIKLFEKASRILTQDYSPAFSFITGKLIINFIDNYDTNLNKIETLNKNFLLNQKKDFNFYLQITEFLAPFLKFNENSSRNFLINNIIQIEQILDIYLSIIFKKKNSTLAQDLEKTINLLKTPFYFQFLIQISLINNPEIIFKASLLMNSIIECLDKTEKVHIYQKMILDNSTLMLKHIEFCISPVLLKQKQSSILLIYHCLIDNIEAGELITRLIPEPLFKSIIENSYDTSKWSLSMWEELFKNLNLNFNTPTLQWNYQSRLELLNIIRKENSKFYENLKSLSNNMMEEIIQKMFSNEKFELEKNLEEAILQLIWNYSVYEVSYESLNCKIPIFKYYLQELLVDKENPNFSLENIVGSRIFWDKLTNAYIACHDIEKKIIYLKCLILLYQKYFGQIKDFNFINIIVRNLKIEENLIIVYLFLQLIWTFLNVSDKILQIKNYKAFVKSDGISLILDIIRNQIFKEELIDFDYQSIKNSPPKDFKIIYCFTEKKLPREAYNETLLKSNIIIFCLRIFSNCVERTISQYNKSLLMIPSPLSKKIAFKKSSILLFQTLLLIRDDNILNEVLNFFCLTYMDKFHFKKLIQNRWIFPLLISRIKRDTSESILSFFKDILENLILSEEDETKQFLLAIKNLDLLSPINDLKIYSFHKSKLNEATKKVFDAFCGLYYLPPYFWYSILNNKEKMLDILFEEHCDSFLIWNKNSFEKIRTNLIYILQPLKENDFNKEYNPSVMKFSFANELTVGPLILKNWVFFKEKNKLLNSSNFKLFIQKLIKYFDNHLDILRHFEFKYEDLVDYLKELHIILEVLSNLYKNNDNLSFKYYDSLIKFLQFYYDVIGEPSVETNNSVNLYERNSYSMGNINDSVSIHIEESEGGEGEGGGSFSKKINETESENDYTPNKQNFKKKRIKSRFHFEQDLKIKMKKNYLYVFDFCLQNCFKLLKNVLKPERGGSTGRRFIENEKMLLVIIKIMQRPVISEKNNKLKYTFNNFKTNLLFLNILFNIFEKNGYTLIPFVPLNIKGFHDIEHILTNLDLRIIDLYIKFLSEKLNDSEEEQKNKAKLDSLVITPEEIQENNRFIETIEGIKNINGIKKIDHKVLEKIGIEGKDIVIEEEENKEEGEKELKEEMSEITESMLLMGSDGLKNDKNMVPEDFKNLNVKFEPKDDEDKYLIIKIKEIRRSSLKYLLKSLDLEGIRKTMGSFDFSKTKIDEKFFRHVDQRPRIYFELKNILKELLKLWILIVYKLSRNANNCKKIIKSSLALKCFSLSFNYFKIKNNPDIIYTQINLFSQICYKIFYNVLNFAIMATIVNKPIEAELIKNNVNNQKFNKLFNMAEQVEKDSEILINFYKVLKCFLGKEFLYLIIKNQNDFIKKIVTGVHSDSLIVNREKLDEITRIINQQIIQNLCNDSYDDFPILVGEAKIDLK